MVDIDEYTSDDLIHYGIARKSGRYPWGSGDDPYQRSMAQIAYVKALRDKGLSEAVIAKGLGMSTTELRAASANAKSEKRAAEASEATRLKDKGMSNVAIGKQMGIPESSVRALLDPTRQERNDVLKNTADILRKEVAAKTYLDVGIGTESQLGIAKTKLDTSIAILKDEGYQTISIQVPQVGMPGQYTDVKVLVAPGVTYSDLSRNRHLIQPINSHYSEDGGHTYQTIKPPVPLSSKRIDVRYGKDGGSEMDGVLEIRPGVHDLSMGEARYAQVRVAVDGSHYVKGMAMYAHDLPKGIDVRFNTNKDSTGNKLDAFKAIKDDPENPFGSIVRQKHVSDGKGGTIQSVLNMVGSPLKEKSGEEGGWSEWSKNLSPQFLSKQSESLARSQLDKAFHAKKADYDEIMSFNNPAVRKKLLDSFADDCDSAAVHLKAASLPRQATHVILPIRSLKDNEIYAPNFKQGESVVLIRYPHGGTFEIPELKVNNKHIAAKSILGNVKDAVGINSRVAKRLSGADFDGDTVIVIPNREKLIRTSAPLKALKNFDPISDYKAYDGMKTIDGGVYHAKTGKVEYGKTHDGKPKQPSGKLKQREMGDVSNLITDMTIKGAAEGEIARAVKHSMVVIDSEKHVLNYKQSYHDNGIAELKTKYQGGKRSGASTLISKAKSEIRVPDRRLRKASEEGPVDPKTGKKVYVPTGTTYTTLKRNARTGEVVEKTVPRMIKSKKMAETHDAFSLIKGPGTPMEEIYATHANRLKALANKTRIASINTPPHTYSPSAKRAYDTQAKSLTAKLNIALKNKPLERQAQLLANAEVSAKRKAHPNMDGADLKKIKGQALIKARDRVGARKQRVDITPLEWEAIQAGAISNNKLIQILNNTDVDVVKQYATPRAKPAMSTARMTRAKAMLSRGHTQAEVAELLGVSVSTINKALS